MLVVLYSTSWRNWESAVESQIKHIPDDSIIGVHYWKYSTTPISQLIGESDITYEVPKDIPVQLRGYKYKHSITENEIVKDEVFPIIAASLYYKILSSRIAFKNALDIYPDMPDDQPILWTRPDVFIGTYFPTKVKKNEFISIWNTKDRLNPAEPEMGDIIALTTKHVIEKILNLELSLIKEICAHCKFSEQYLYAILKYLNVEITFDHSIKVGLMRNNGISRCTTTKSDQLFHIQVQP